MRFEAPVFTFWGILYTAVGSAVYWNWLGRTKLEAFTLSKTWRMLPVSPKARSIVEFAAFLILGVVVGIGFAQPQNPRQALTAGFAWTSVFGGIKRRSEAKRDAVTKA